MPRIKVKSSLSLSDAFEAFLMSKKSEGLSNKTITTYDHQCVAWRIRDFLSAAVHGAKASQRRKSRQNQCQGCWR